MLKPIGDPARRGLSAQAQTSLESRITRFRESGDDIEWLFGS
jgi:hypothetical protein